MRITKSEISMRTWRSSMNAASQDAFVVLPETSQAIFPEEQKEDAFVQGMEKIYKQLMTELEALEVTPIEAVGTEFDPEFHNAVMQVENDELESGMVAQELQKGYMYRDTVVRHSMVAVVQ